MARLLYIESSPRKERSHSIAVARAFLEAYQAANPQDEVETWDLWESPLPEFDGYTIDAKYQVMHGQEHTEEQANAWGAVQAIFDRFNAADKYLLSLPMWNFGIPYKLKHFFDIIMQPGMSFSFSPETGYTGLVTGKPICVVYARGGAYSGEEMVGMDFQKRYVELALGFMGFTDVRPVVIEPTMGEPGAVNATRTAAQEEVKKVAAEI